MSNQLKNNLNAIELTENELDNIVGGNLAALETLHRTESQRATESVNFSMKDLYRKLLTSDKEPGKTLKNALPK